MDVKEAGRVERDALSVGRINRSGQHKLSMTEHRAPIAHAFTLVELLLVITIIAILMGLLFPAFKGVQDQAKRTQAKNDLTQIVMALNAFSAEYGQYPCAAQTGNDPADYFAGDDPTQAKLFADLRGVAGLSDPAVNPKLISFIQVPSATASVHAQAKSGLCAEGHYHDPWGNPYRIKIDNNYNNQLENPYIDGSGAGSAILNLGTIAWSIGADADGATTGVMANGGPKTSGKSNDDVISWQ